MISLPINCARKAVNDFHLHFDNGVDGVENEAGYIVTERQSYPIGLGVWFLIKSVLVTGTGTVSCGILSGTESVGGSLNLSQALPLNLSRNFRLLRSQLSKECSFLSSYLIFFFGGFLDLGGGKTHPVGCGYHVCGCAFLA